MKNHNFDLILSDTALQTSAEEAVTNHLIEKVPVRFLCSCEVAEKGAVSAESLADTARDLADRPESDL